MKKLLHIGRNHKIDKNDKTGIYRTAHLNLAPFDSSGMGMTVCPKASPGCKASCLFTSGWGSTPRVIKSRIETTKYYLNNRREFLSQLYTELDRHDRYCAKRGITPVVRLNMTSDILWERHGVVQAFPDIQFYDYTKIPGREVPENYHLTFSADESNRRDCQEAIWSGLNVCVVYREPDWQRFQRDRLEAGFVIDGDLHDLRFLDPKGVIVGVKAKGRAVYDRTGFVRDADPECKYREYIFQSSRWHKFKSRIGDLFNGANSFPQG